MIGMLILFFVPRYQKNTIRWIDAPTSGSIFYLQTWIDATVNGIKGMLQQYLNLVHVQRENDRLSKKIEHLQGENNLLKENVALAQRLQTLLHFKNQSPIRLLAASVIGREPSHWFQTITINQGDQAGVEVDMGVMTPSGIVGRVIKVTHHSSQVLLITDSSNAVASIVQGTRDEGIIQGTADGAVRLKYISSFSDVRVGETVITSGLEGSFTKGLNIGKVASVQRQDRDRFLSIIVTPEVKISNLEEVLVILSVESEG